ncbi:MAG: glycoside hydrolase family 16 protein, partial [Mycobacteriales bacterium]
AYTNRPENVSMDGNGNLAITVQREDYTLEGSTRHYTSGRIHSSGLHSFGAPVRIEARMRTPVEEGLVPAFWTLGRNYENGSGPVAWPDSGEIDILEVANAPRTANYHIHGPDDENPLDQTANRDINLSGSHTHSSKLVSDFHVYGVDIFADRINFRFDDKTRFTLTRQEYEAAGGQWEGVFDQEQYLLLNIGSLHSWVGEPTFSNRPQLLVDWVRVYGM